MKIKIDGALYEIAENSTVYDALKVADKITKDVIAAKIGDKTVALTAPLTGGEDISPVTFADKDGKKVFWHTSAHIMAQAVKRLYPEVQLTIGPAVDNGFYYDFDAPKPFTPDDLAKIEHEMEKIVRENLRLVRSELPRAEALALMRDNPYKVELISALPEGAAISFYTQGDFVDLCAGPHLFSTGAVKAIKLTAATGAYWHGDQSQKQLQRVYGVSFPTKDGLKEYLDRLEQAKARDHRKIGRELDLFDIYDEGPGFPFFLPKGMVLRNNLESYWRAEHKARGYEEIRTPIMLNRELWYRSGHWDHYKDNMYSTKIDDVDFAVKPMNCPGGMLVFRRKIHSYRDLPQRIAELGLVHRHEMSGALHGLMRVRCFTQDDAHIFMTPEQIEGEVLGVMRLIDDFYKTFGFNYHVELSTRPKSSMGSDEQWERATAALRKALEASGRSYIVNEGDGAFYGPKIDFHLEDSIGRTWQCGTIQLDFQMPERFDLSYVGADNERHRPVMIHRVVFGSIERFIAILTEHYAGAFPLWLAPIQLKVLPVSETSTPYAAEVFRKLEAAGYRVELDDRNEKIGYKIREAQLLKVPYMLVLGDKEAAEGIVSVRDRKTGATESMTYAEFIEKIEKEIGEKA